ncbi:MAG TPA: carbonic anhydrase [Sphingomonas sp.]
MTSFNTLLDGYRRFRDTGWATQRARWTELADGQSPNTLVIACSDSRVDPAQIFDVSPGEIFVVRNVSNLVPPFERDTSRHGVSAAVEFAVTQIPVTEIIVLGHEYCGGCKAAMTRAFAGAAPGEGGFIAHWVDMLDDARDAVVARLGQGDEAERALEHEAVKVSLANLRSFPFVDAAEKAGRLTLRGAWFAIRDGELRLLDEADGAFHPI